jgi:sulfur carrier protein|tara:strand:+ start:1827 stop:2039 length:213 start_codon:yes stop_codon:yes gene_type:complete
MFNQTTFFFNGNEYYTKKSITLEALLNYFNYNSLIFVVEYNQFICNKNKWKEIKIKQNDRIEIITIVGGG